MATIVIMTGERGPRGVVPFVGAFATTAVSGLIFASLATTVFLKADALAIVAMLPIVFGTAAFNGVVVQALYLPLKKAVRR